MDIVTIDEPFETHVHGRDGLMLNAVAPHTASQFWGAIFEPNLLPPVTSQELALGYVERIRAACPENPGFQPFTLLYLTDTLDPDEVAEAMRTSYILGAKFYPRGATTNSDSGIADVTTLYTPGSRQYECIKAIGKAGRVMQLHCELNFDLDGFELDPYEKEGYFFKHIMPRLRQAHPTTRFSCEHLTTLAAAEYMIANGNSFLGCSVTPHHLLSDRRDMFRGGLRPHLFCLPPIKHYREQSALRALVTGGFSFVYAGTDSAPHDRGRKEAECCSGGIFSAHAAVEFYAEAFDEKVYTPLFNDFMSKNGPLFYGLAPSHSKRTLRRNSWSVDDYIHCGDGQSIQPYGYDAIPEKRKTLTWKLD